MINLLQRYGEEEMDQWENWKIGPIYIAIQRQPLPGTFDIQYDNVPYQLAEKKKRS